MSGMGAFVVVGAGPGPGAAAARRFGREGHPVGLIARSAESLEPIAADLPHLHSFTNGLEPDRAAVDAGLTRPHHNGRAEGVNTRTKRITRQMHGRAGFPLLRHRILLQ
ncbi:hypothetical protein GTZ85_15770 [Streptomyces sp. SID5474]|nr:hypothetical protein [Streptomyces sp. SID5474]